MPKSSDRARVLKSLDVHIEKQIRLSLERDVWSDSDEEEDEEIESLQQLRASIQGLCN